MEKIGRPTKYSAKVLFQSKEYLNNYEELGEIIPSIEGLSDCLFISRSTIYQWANHKEKEEFSDIIERLLAKQGKVLINKGLRGDFNPTITRLILSKHGYRKDEEEDRTRPSQPIYINLPEELVKKHNFGEKVYTSNATHNDI